jgi:hypothetical protein
MGLIGLALEDAQIDANGKVDSTSLEREIETSAAPPGVSVTWSEIESGIRRSEAGETIYYSGITGPMLLDPCGARKIGVTTTWSIAGGSIVALP